jgi:hypothetical protein
MNEQPRNDLRGSLVERQLRVRERLHVFWEVASSILERRIVGVVPIRSLKMDRRVWEGELDSTVRCRGGDTSRVIKVEVGEDDIGDRAWFETPRFFRGISYTVDLALLIGPLLSHPYIYEETSVAHIDDK